MNIVNKHHNATYKDGNRVWWRIDLDWSRKDPKSNPIDPDNYWNYKLINVDQNIVIATGEIWCQYDLVPTIESVLCDIQDKFNRLFMGFAKYSNFYKTIKNKKHESI